MPLMLRLICAVLLVGPVIVCQLAALGLGYSGSTNDALWALLIGAMFGQIALLAVWTAWGPFPLFWRLPSGIFLAAWLSTSYLIVAGFSAGLRQRGLSTEEFAFTLVFLAQWLVVQIPLWAKRIGFGWRLGWRDEPNPDNARRELQFGIRQLFVWTTVVALLLGICRLVLPQLDVSNASGLSAETVAIFVILLAANSLLAMPIVWAAFARTRLLLWWAIAGACAVVLTVAEMVAYYFFVFRADDVVIFVLMNLIQFTATSVSLLLLRTVGFRLVQSDRRCGCGE